MRTSHLFVLAPIVCAVAMAQESRGTITGTVSDPQGAAIPGAAVVAKNLGTNLEAKTSTNESGVYVLPFLTNARFGLLGNTQTNDPRNTQAALKITF
jgi:Carboxypeptidase regulatory-like domain